MRRATTGGLHAGLGVLLLLALALPGGIASAQQAAAEEGWLHVIWDDENGPVQGEPVRLFLVGRDGSARELEPTGGADRLQEILALDRQYVRVDAGAQITAGPVPVGDVRAAAAPRAAPAADNGLRTPFATLLCRFQGDPVPFEREAIEVMQGGEYPGMAHYYDEISGITGVLDGSVVTDWLPLPEPRSGYVNGTFLDFGKIARDCVRAGQEFMDLRPFFGINMQFSNALSTRSVTPFDPLSFGGSWTAFIEGQPHQFGMTWMSSVHAFNYMVYAHEMGHALGWPHSSGAYGQEYDSDWDVMSKGYVHRTDQFGWVPIHTISSHKDHRGWIPAARRWEPQPGTETTGTIVRSALPPAGEGYLMARIPTHSFPFYTVEVRKLAGYDAVLPGQTVLLHEVRGVRSYVVDATSNGNPNDAGAMWMPGETFLDAEAGVEVAVLSETADGFVVRIRNGPLLRVEIEGEGSVTGVPGTACAESCRYLSADRHERLTLVAEPAGGLVLRGWSGACTGTGTCSVEMRGDVTVQALFGPALDITTAGLRRPVMGAAYADTLRAFPTDAVGSWSVQEGDLPPGLSLSSAGVVSGIATASGRFPFTAAVELNGGVATRALELDVTRPLLSATNVLQHLLGETRLSADHQRFLDLVGNRNGRMDIGDVRAWMMEAGHLSASEIGSLEAVVGPLRSHEE